MKQPLEVEQQKNKKGNKIVVVRGKYIGCRGWINQTKGYTAECVHVLLEVEGGNAIPKCLKQGSIKVKGHQAKPNSKNN